MPRREGITQYWSEGQERFYERLLAGSSTPAMQHLVMTIRDLLKYDQRSKQAKRAVTQGRLRLATATDDELADLARLEARIGGNSDPRLLNLKLEQLKQLRQSVREQGIRKEEITG